MGKTMEENVVKIGEYSFKLHRDRDYLKECKHQHSSFSDNGNYITCDDCGVTLDPYWLLKELVACYDRAITKLNHDRAALKELEKTHVILKAAKAVEKAWRSRHHVPTCPHCHTAIMPEDGFGHSGFVGREIELARRARANGEKGKLLD